MTRIYDETLDGNLGLDDPSICIMKRSGERVPFNERKIIAAIKKANDEEGILALRLTDDEIIAIARGIKKNALNAGRDLSVEEIQDKVEDALMASGKHSVARLYITYRYKHRTGNYLISIRRFLVSLKEIMKRSNRRIQTRIQLSSLSRGIIWLVSGLGIIQTDIFYLMISHKLIRKVSSISMMLITLLSICTTAVWSISMTCSKIAPASLEQR